MLNKKTLFVGVSAFILSISQIVLACTCIRPDVETAKRQADIVFAGRVNEVLIVDTKTKWEPRVIIKFSVARVWKGDVSENFTMYTNLEASSCQGFFRELVEPGSILLVYGFAHKASDWKKNNIAGAPNAASFTVGQSGGDIGTRMELLNQVPDRSIAYTTNICSRTMPVEYAAEDFKLLGEFREIAKLEIMPDAVLLEAMRDLSNGLPDECGELSDAKAWAAIQHPENLSELAKILELSEMYSSIPKVRPAEYRDYWVTDDNARIGMCRVSMADPIVCGEAKVVFVRDNKVWKVDEGRVSSYCKSP